MTIVELWSESTPFRTVVALAVPLIAWLVRMPVANLLVKLLKTVSKGIGITVGDRLEKSLVPANEVFVVALGGLVANESIGLPDPAFSIVENALISACVAAAFVALYSQCDDIPKLIERKRTPRVPEQLTWVVRVAKSLLVFVGTALVLRVWGIDIGPVLAGMGLIGAAVALAAQDYLKNFLAGFTNAAEHRFGEGDWIRVGGLAEGTVELVDLRSTMIRQFDLAPVHVPNSELANAPLINFSRRPYRRIYWKIALTYVSSVDTLRGIREQIEAYIDSSGYYVPEQTASRFVRIDSFNDSSIDMLVYCFTRSNTYGGYLEAREELVLAIKSIVAAAGGSFAFPSRTIYVEASPDAHAGRFVATQSGESVASE